MINDLRDSYFDHLLQTTNHCGNSVILSVDMGAKSFGNDAIRGRAKIINVGVSESNAVSVAAGLSSCGVKAFVYGICAFLMNRPRAQIRHDAIIGNNPVHLIGSGPGLAYDRDGPSHHSLDEISLARSLPGFKVFSPFDYRTAVLAVDEAFRLGCSTFCRLDKGAYPDISSKMDQQKGVFLSYGRDKNRWFVCSGVRTHTAIEMADQVGGSVASLFEIGPDTVNVIGDILPDNALVTVIDESHEAGGLLQVLAEANLIYGKALRLGARGIQNKFIQEKMSRDQLFKAYQS